MNCSQQQLDWNHRNMPHTCWEPQPQQMRHLNGSNMSLNLPPQHAYYPQQHNLNPRRNEAPPPTAWNNGWGVPNMFPYGPGMPPAMNQGKVLKSHRILL